MQNGAAFVKLGLYPGPSNPMLEWVGSRNATILALRATPSGRLKCEMPMVKSTPLPNGSVVIKPQRRRNGAGLMFILVLLIAGVLALAGVGLFAPTRLALVQEQALGLLHGGVVNTSEQTFVDGCVQTEGAVTPQAVTRTRRTLVFRDGTSLEVTFSGAPAPTNVQCP